MLGHSTRPSWNCVTCRGAPPLRRASPRFPAPPGWLMEYTPAPSALHMGHRHLKSPPASFSYLGAGVNVASQISDSSRWLWPCRHHWLDVLPRAVKASDLPSGEGAEKNSLT